MALGPEDPAGLCWICSPQGGPTLCPGCSRAYDRFHRRNDDGSVWAVMGWAANRARLFERRRAKARR